jgi:hypothetical protein
MRPLLLAAAMTSASCLLGCTSMLRPIGQSLSPNYAALHFVPALDSPDRSYPGLYSVGNQDLPESQRFLAYVARGRRTISYYCSGPVFFDWIPSVTFEFQPGLEYELICKGSTATIRVKAGA